MAVLRTLLLPPAALFLAVALGLLLRRTRRPGWRRGGSILASSAAGTLVLRSVPWVSGRVRASR